MACPHSCSPAASVATRGLPPTPRPAQRPAHGQPLPRAPSGPLLAGPGGSPQGGGAGQASLSAQARRTGGRGSRARACGREGTASRGQAWAWAWARAEVESLAGAQRLGVAIARRAEWRGRPWLSAR